MSSWIAPWMAGWDDAETPVPDEGFYVRALARARSVSIRCRPRRIDIKQRTRFVDMPRRKRRVEIT